MSGFPVNRMLIHTDRNKGMTKNRVRLTILGVGLICFAWMILMAWQAGRDVDARLKEPTPACKGYNSNQFPGHFWIPKQKVEADKQDRQAGKDEKQPEGNIELAALEASCQSVAITVVALKMGWFALIGGLVSVVLAALALAVPAILEDYRSVRTTTNVGAFLVLDADYVDARTAPAWRAVNLGDRDAVIVAITMLESGSGVTETRLLAATWHATRLVLIPGDAGSLSHPIPIAGTLDDVVVAVRLEGGGGRQHYSWARFQREGAPAIHSKKEDGRVG